MKRIIVTGCNGQLGRAINKELEKSNEFSCVNTDVAELDITNIDQVLKLTREVKPYAIINCAAHTAVDKCETDYDNAFRINAIGPRNLSIAATQAGAKMIHVSTDYVFDGTKEGAYYETDTPNPQGAYGTTKLAGERFVEQFAQKYFIIRTAWLYGDGKNFIKTMLRLSETNDQVKVVGDQFGSPTSAEELAKSIIYLLPTENYGLFHGTCEDSCSWDIFAREIFKMAGKNTTVQTITTQEFGAAAPRPANSVLENYMFKMTSDFSYKSWRDALAIYMRNL